MSVITKLEDGTEVDDTFVTSIDSIMILKDMIGDDKVFDENHEIPSMVKKLKGYKRSGVEKINTRIIIIKIMKNKNRRQK